MLLQNDPTCCWFWKCTYPNHPRRIIYQLLVLTKFLYIMPPLTQQLSVMLWTLSWTRALACSASRNYKHEPNVNHHYSFLRGPLQRSVYLKLHYLTWASSRWSFSLNWGWDIVDLFLLKCVEKKKEEKRREVLIMALSLKHAKYLAFWVTGVRKTRFCRSKWPWDQFAK